MKTGLALTCDNTRAMLSAMRRDILADIDQHTRFADPDATTLCAVLTHINAALHLLQEEKLQ